MNKYTFLSLGYGLLLLMLAACSSPKNIPYFRDLSDSVRYNKVPQAKFANPVIQPDDILNISIQTIDPGAAAAVNQKSIEESVTGASTAANIGSQQVSGILVDKNGEVEIPVIGTIKVSGLTTFQARQIIRKKAEAYFVNPAVQVRFVNFRITVIGEVAKPATYTLPNEKVTLLDAIGMAGDLTIYGKRDNVLLIRDNGFGDKELIRFDLTKSALFQSPYYYLKQNDVIYIEPNKAKVANTDGTLNRTYAILASAFSVVAIIISRFL